MYKIDSYEKDFDIEFFYNKYVDVEKYFTYCEECGNLEKNWNCPPFDFDPNELWNSFNNLKVIVYKIEFNQELLEHEFSKSELDMFLMRLFKIKIKLMSPIYNLENEKSLGLYFGPCNLCMKCTREFGMPCKMPHKMRYSIESLGGNIEDLVKNEFDIELKWIENEKLPNYLLFVGGLLYNKK